MYYLELHSTSIFPFGYSSVCKVGGVTLQHEMILLNDALTYRVVIKSNPHNAKVHLRLLQNDEQQHITAPERSWSKYKPMPQYNALVVSVIDRNKQTEIKEDTEEALTQRNAFNTKEPPLAKTFIGVSSDLPLSFYKTPEVFNKTYLTTGNFKKQAALFITFSTGQSKLYKRINVLQKSIWQETDKVIAEFRERMKTQAKINMPEKEIQSCLSVMSPLLDSLKIPEIPGGMRAADAHYWIWGWDSMVYADSMLIAGQHKFVREMLEFYKKTAHPELGIFHAISTRGLPTMSMAEPAQCIYVVMLYWYYTFTGDIKALREFYPFALTLIKRAGKKEAKNSGLIEGVALYPDFPEHVDQNGNDISTFNNSIYYQALRTAETLAEILDDKEKIKTFNENAKKLKRGFRKYLYDRNKGYFVDSVSSRDFSKRKHYPSYAILWLTDFAEELVEGIVEPVASFMQNNLKASIGVSLYPKWDSCFMRDGNQLGMYMPVNEPFYRNMMRLSGRYKEIDDWKRTVAWSWRQLTMLESLPTEAENEGITLDEPGRKQAFSAKAWYNIFIGCMAGLSFTPNGIIISPTGVSEDLSISNILFVGKKISLKITGKGKYIGRIDVNGKTIRNSQKIPINILKARNNIIIKRSVR